MEQLSNRRVRKASRAMHLALATFLGVFLYSPLVDSAAYTLLMQVAIFPAFVLTGVVMWKIRRIKRLFAGRSRDEVARGG